MVYFMSRSTLFTNMLVTELDRILIPDGEY